MQRVVESIKLTGKCDVTFDKSQHFTTIFFLPIDLKI